MTLKPLKASDTHGGYTPTAEELERAKPRPDQFNLSGDGVFHTIQGEGQFTGIPTTFIRLNVCNLKCSWCDAWYTWKRDEKEFYENEWLTTEQMYKRVGQAQEDKHVRYISKVGDDYTNLLRNIVFTGGEPMLQQKVIAKFMKEYPFFNVQIETNGTIPIIEPIIKEKAYFNCSPKLKNSDNNMDIAYNKRVLQQLVDTNRAIFKFVFRDENDIETIEAVYNFIPRDMIWLMPEGVTKEENVAVFEKTIDRVVATGFNVAVRAQNIMWDGAKRGV